MKTPIRIISVVLCMLFAIPMFSMNVAAKSKNYVKKITVKKYSSITIPANKKSVTKNFTVTIKVKGKASKKFTAKSSKPSIASLKITGKKIKVTAKKAGTTTITVKTKGKDINKKTLKVVFSLKVKKVIVKDSFKKTKNYIDANGISGSDGKFIYMDISSDLRVIIAHIFSKDSLKFMMSKAFDNGDTCLVSFELFSQNDYSTVILSSISDSSGNLKLAGSADLRISTYNREDLYFDILKDYYTPYNQKLCNSSLRLCMSSVEAILIEYNLGSLKDLGFTSYE